MNRHLKIIGTCNGSSMVFVLVITVVLLAGALWAVSTYKTGVYATTQLMDKLQARVEAESAFQLLTYYGATGTFSGGHISNILPVELNVPQFLGLDGQKVSFRKDTRSTVTVSLQDHGGLFNVVYGSKRAFARLLTLCGIPAAEIATIVESLKDWIDSDDLHYPNGAEGWYYQLKAGVDYKPRNNIFVQNSFELALIKGMNSSYLKKILPHITVSPLQGYNVLTMGRVMLAVTLNCTLVQAEQLVALRKMKGFFTQNDIQAVLGGMSSVQTNGLGVPSKIVRITVESVVGDARIELWGEVSFVEDKLGPYRVLTWNEG